MKADGRLFVVDDDAAVREATRALFEPLGVKVLTYSSAEQFLAAYTPELRGCLLAELRLPGMNGLELGERLRAADASIVVVFLTGYGDVPTALQALKHGASHFLTKPVREQALIDAVNEGLQQERDRRGHALARAEIRRRLGTLTRREAEVLEHVIAGRATRITAEALGVSERTVEAHRARAFAKLRVRSVPELIRALSELR